MKKLIIIALISATLTGCSNPISSQIDKEGDETRAEIQAEMAIARQEIDNNIASLSAEIGADIAQTQTMIENFYRIYVGTMIR
jgi:archaellum component FlaG (FlaF/FlaG flagellin family)